MIVFFLKKPTFLFPNRVASHAPTNNMKADNLAIVIGPNILKSPVSHHIPTVLHANVVVVARVCVGSVDASQWRAQHVQKSVQSDRSDDSALHTSV